MPGCVCMTGRCGILLVLGSSLWTHSNATLRNLSQHSLQLRHALVRLEMCRCIFIPTMFFLFCGGNIHIIFNFSTNVVRTWCTPQLVQNSRKKRWHRDETQTEWIEWIDQDEDWLDWFGDNVVSLRFGVLRPSLSDVEVWQTRRKATAHMAACLHCKCITARVKGIMPWLSTDLIHMFTAVSWPINFAGKAMHAQTYTIRTIPLESTNEVGACWKHH